MNSPTSLIQRLIHWLKSTTATDEDEGDFVDEFRKSLRADYMTMDEEAKQKIASAISQQSLYFEKGGAGGNLSLPQLWSLELLILRHMSDRDTLRRSWIIREKFRVLMGDSLYKRYEENLPLTIKGESLLRPTPVDSEGSPIDYALLREDNVNVFRQIQRLAYYRVKRSESIGKKKRFAIWIMIILVVIAVWLYVTWGSATPGRQSEVNLFLLVIYSGMVGAFMSVLQRLEQAAAAPIQITDSAFDSTDIAQGISIIYITSVIVSGAVFAIIMYLVSMAGIVNIVDLLPGLSTAKEACAHTGGMFAGLFCADLDHKTLAKLLIVCFMSGFAERLVPDVLDSLIKKADSQKSK